MVEYEYASLFSNHNRVDLIIVQHGATLTWNSSTEQFTIEDTEYTITNEDVDSESFDLDEKLCSQDDLRFGLCEAAHFSIDIYNRLDLPSLNNELIDVYIYFNGDGATLFQVGVYQVEEDEYSADRTQRSISAYDMLYYVRDADITDWYNEYFETATSLTGTIVFIIAGLINYVNTPTSEGGLGMYMPLNEQYTLTNGAFVVNKTIESDTITFGDFMSALLEINGAFGHINRQGQFTIKILGTWADAPVRTVDDDERFPPTMYNDTPTWGIGGIDVYDRNNIKKFYQRNTTKKRPSIYVMVDPFILADRESGDSTVQTALNRFQNAIYHTNYTPYEVECIGNLCVEVGDRIDVAWTPSAVDTRSFFRSYVFERRIKGLQGMTDIYSAKGNLKQPLYKITNDRWHNGDSTAATTGQSTGGVSILDDEHDKRVIALLRNYGEPMLDEPVVDLVYNKEDGQVEIKWTDPADITSYSPLPIAWAGTEVVRKEGSAPLHGWSSVDSEYGGTVLITSTTRDEYSSDAYVDDTIEPNKRYYYAIRPYYIKLDDADHPIKQYRWTKIISVDTQRSIVAPTITTVQVDGTSVTALYLIPALEVGSYTSIKLAAKKNNIPASISDADKVMDISEPTTLIPIGSATMTGLDELSQYYFVIFVEDDAGNTVSSEPMDCMTGELTSIVLFTDHFNESMLVDDWDIETYQSQSANGYNRWAPLSLTNYYLTAYNLLAGNSERRPLTESGGTLTAAYRLGMSDGCYWIPIRRTPANGRAVISFECFNTGSGEYYYCIVQLAYIDSNGNWNYIGNSDHRTQQANTWEHYSDEVTGNFEYIDYIGIAYCDGTPQFRNVEIIL